MITLASHIRKIAKRSETDFFESKLKDKYGLDVIIGPKVYDAHCILRQICNIFDPVPSALIKKCGIKTLRLRNDMGPNKPYYPNHGYFDTKDEVALNADIFYNPDLPDDFFDHRGYFMTRPQQTLLHEFSHAYDWANGELSKKEAWLKISGWSKEKKPGLKRLIIDEPGTPKVIGEMYYDPKAEGFTRFYARRNSWDDWADSSAFYLGGLRGKVPTKKRPYFDDIYKEYYS